MVFTLCQLSHSIAVHEICVQRHKVNYTNRNKSAVDCSIVLKFGTEFDRGEAGLLYDFHDQKSKIKVTGSKFNVTA